MPEPAVHARRRVEASPQWRDGKFRNTLPRVDGPVLRAMGEFFFGGSKHRRPAVPIPVVPRTRASFDAPPASGLRVTWLGHSTTLLEIDGRRLLLDPVWSERASPVAFAGPRRFFAPPLPLDQLPAIDAILLSHDHYDHLDEALVRALAGRGLRWVAPLGVGAHLARWGVPDDGITELDWWEATTVRELVLTATPARHFSGRGLTGMGQSLWAGWALHGVKAADGRRHRVFYSGDTAMHDDFAAIGRRLGPFDLTLFDAGAYDALWADVHMGPEQAVEAHRLVGGEVMLPLHWGTFDLALHGWTEPVERVLAAAGEVRVVVPRPGESVEPATAGGVRRWWPEVPWRTAVEAPVRSSHLRGTVAASRRPPST